MVKISELNRKSYIVKFISLQKYTFKRLYLFKKLRIMEYSEIDDEIQKVKRRIPGWINKPHQVNSRILKLYMDLTNNGQTGLFLDMFKDEFETLYPEEEFGVFDTNYNQMKNFGPKNHGKVFSEDDEKTVTLWAPVKDFVVACYAFKA